MSSEKPFAPVILYSEDAEAIHDALLASGHTDLAQTIRLKANRSRLDKMYAEHVVCGSDDEFDHDDEPVISQGASGAYVMVWRWVYKGEIRDTLREKRDAQHVASSGAGLAS
jgi:hypothetical protein